MMAASSIGVTIEADDFGASAARDRGILLAISFGLINAVSAFAVSRWRGDRKLPERVLATLRRTSAGIHLDLTDGPFTTEAFARWVQSRRLHGDKRDVWLAGVAGELPLSLAGEEIRSQFARFRETFGRWPTHVSGHNHIHISHPDLFAVTCDLSAAHSPGTVRVPYESPTELDPLIVCRCVPAVSDSRGTSVAGHERDDLAILVRAMRTCPIADYRLYERCIERLPAAATELYHGTTYGHLRSLKALDRVLARMAAIPGAHRFVVHPGLSWRGKAFEGADRLRELILLYRRRPTLRALLEGDLHES